MTITAGVFTPSLMFSSGGRPSRGGSLLGYQLAIGASFVLCRRTSFRAWNMIVKCNCSYLVPKLPSSEQGDFWPRTCHHMCPIALGGHARTGLVTTLIPALLVKPLGATISEVELCSDADADSDSERQKHDEHLVSIYAKCNRPTGPIEPYSVPNAHTEIHPDWPRPCHEGGELVMRVETWGHAVSVALFGRREGDLSQRVGRDESSCLCEGIPPIALVVRQTPCEAMLSIRFHAIPSARQPPHAEHPKTTGQTYTSARYSNLIPQLPQIGRLQRGHIAFTEGSDTTPPKGFRLSVKVGGCGRCTPCQYEHVEC
ncbi:hypothetical protein B0J17DRAFT_624765 [Rhizoctonia solani]|nr:hypothetical protein B0J17DRAFT_624765 [Rhizoctonia solani]